LSISLPVPYGELAAKAKDLRGSIASRDLRAEQPDGLRQDALSYCFQALQLFEEMEQQRFMAVLSEVAAVGQSGLQINEPGTSRSPVAARKDDAPAACQAAINNVAAVTPFSGSGGLIQTTSG
jgi:hypothetical protein